MKSKFSQAKKSLNTTHITLCLDKSEDESTNLKSKTSTAIAEYISFISNKKNKLKQSSYKHYSNDSMLFGFKLPVISANPADIIRKKKEYLIKYRNKSPCTIQEIQQGQHLPLHKRSKSSKLGNQPKEIDSNHLTFKDPFLFGNKALIEAEKSQFNKIKLHKNVKKNPQRIDSAIDGFFHIALRANKSASKQTGKEHYNTNG